MFGKPPKPKPNPTPPPALDEAAVERANAERRARGSMGMSSTLLGSASMTGGALGNPGAQTSTARLLGGGM